MREPELFEIRFPDGRLQKGACLLTPSATKNLLCIVGMNGWHRRWLSFAEALNENGINFYAVDPMGQGLNAKPNQEMVVEKGAFKQNVEALKIKLDELQKELSTSILGHSAGSFAVELLLETYPSSAEKVIICGTDYPKIKYLFGYGLLSLITNEKNGSKPDYFLDKMAAKKMNKHIENPLTKYDWTTRDQESIKARLEDSHANNVTPKCFFKELLWGIKTVRHGLKKISPDENILLIYGSADPFGGYGKGPKKLEKKYKKLGLQNVSSIEYEDYRHELLNELNNERVFADIIEFIKSN